MTQSQKQIKEHHDKMVELLKQEWEEHSRALEADPDFEPKSGIAGIVALGFYERPETKGKPIDAKLNVTAGGEQLFFENTIKKGIKSKECEYIHDLLCGTNKNPLEQML